MAVTNRGDYVHLSHHGHGKQLITQGIDIAELAYDLATSLVRLTCGIHFGPWTPSNRFHNLQTKRHILHAYTLTNTMVYIHRILLRPDMIDTEIKSNRWLYHIWLCNRSQDTHTLQLKNGGRLCDVAR